MEIAHRAIAIRAAAKLLNAKRTAWRVPLAFASNFYALDGATGEEAR